MFAFEDLQGLVVLTRRLCRVRVPILYTHWPDQEIYSKVQIGSCSPGQAQPIPQSPLGSWVCGLRDLGFRV